ncbi:MAG: hypothetical protein J3K34DRAFT_114955 [Monoraphidium minutum]|nr:MAG: hypothetical protein J3K34DRAFT_114955 [Monoraphidium minutum]
MAAAADDLGALGALLASTKICDITAQQQDIVSLQHNNTVGEALRHLAGARILSAPVVVASGLEDFENGGLPPGDAAPSLLGWLDVSDVVKAFLGHLHEKKLVLPKSMLQLMALLEKEGPDFADKMLVTVVGGEDRGLLYQADAGASVLTAIQGFFPGGAAPKAAAAGPEPMEGVDGGGAAPAPAPAGPAAAGGGRKVVHRLAVFNALGEITHIVSQTDVIRFLLKHRAALGGVASRSIRDLGLLDGKGPLVILQPHTPTLLAFEQLAAAGVTGAPVIASDGELIANLSVSDIRCIEPAHFGVLALPLAEFLALSHGTSYLGYSARSSKGAFHPFFAAAAAAAARRGTCRCR